MKRTDVTMVKRELEKWRANGNLVLPPNLVLGELVQFAGDNINIHAETLEGKGMLNTTQYAAFQYGQGEEAGSSEPRVIGKEKSIIHH